MSYMIEVDNLVKRFRRVRKVPISSGLGRAHWLIALSFIVGSRSAEEIVAVDHVNLKVRKGELFGLLGPNGAGKTTFIKCLSTLLTPDGGTAIINGYDILKEADKVKRCINVIGSGQWTSFSWALSVRENLELFASLYGLRPDVARERISNALEVVGLKDKGMEQPDKLSSGIRQKMIIAKGLLLKAPLFFMDEPTVGLDPASARDIRRYIKEELSKNLGITILLTTHYMQEAEQLCDRIAIMDRGSIVACGTPEELRKLVKRGEVVKVEAINIGDRTIDDLRRINLVENVAFHIDDQVLSSGVIRIRTKSVNHILPAVLRAIEYKGSRILHVSISQPTLEDLFIEMTGRGS